MGMPGNNDFANNIPLPDDTTAMKIFNQTYQYDERHSPRKHLNNYFFVIILIVFLLVHTSCSSDWYVRKYKLIKKEGINIDTLKVRTDGIYINKGFVIDIDKSVKPRYSFIRFFNNGREYYSNEYHNFPTDENFNDLQNGGYSYYSIKDSLLISESYNYEAGCFFSYYKILKNGDMKYEGTSSRKWNKYPILENIFTGELYYKFYKIKLVSKPFW